jgi:hypothetical protein
MECSQVDMCSYDPRSSDDYLIYQNKMLELILRTQTVSVNVLLSYSFADLYVVDCID